MERQFTGLGLAATRVEALTPIDLSDRQRQATAGGGMEGALCCVLSHRRAIGDFVASTAAWALILEDDAAVLSGKSSSFPYRVRNHPAGRGRGQDRSCHAISFNDLSRLFRDRTLPPASIYRLGLGSCGICHLAPGRPHGAEYSRTQGRLDMDELLFHDVNPLARRLRALSRPSLVHSGQPTFRRTARMLAATW